MQVNELTPEIIECLEESGVSRAYHNDFLANYDFAEPIADWIHNRRHVCAKVRGRGRGATIVGNQNAITCLNLMAKTLFVFGVDVKYYTASSLARQLIANGADFYTDILNCDALFLQSFYRDKVSRQDSPFTNEQVYVFNDLLLERYARRRPAFVHTDAKNIDALTGWWPYDVVSVLKQHNDIITISEGGIKR